MDTREVELGGGVEATIRRPDLAVWFQWEELAEKLRAQDRAKERLPEPPREKGRDEPPPEPEPEPDRYRLSPEVVSFVSDTLLPNAVVEVRRDGEPVLLHVPDLGPLRFNRLLVAIQRFVLENEEAAFRGYVEPEAGEAADTTGEGDRPVANGVVEGANA